MRKRNYNKLDRILEIPKEVCSDIPKVIMTGFDEIIIENFKGILEYEDYFVRINTHIGIININGFNLNLENMTNDDIKVTGKIESMDMERSVDIKIIFSYLIGYLGVTIEGYYIERFINMCRNKKIAIWHLRRKEEVRLDFRINVQDFKEACKIAKKTKCKIKIKEEIEYIGEFRKEER